MAHFIAPLELERTVFRSDHASNWLVLKGTLNADKKRLLGAMRRALANPKNAPYDRPGQEGYNSPSSRP